MVSSSKIARLAKLGRLSAGDRWLLLLAVILLPLIDCSLKLLGYSFVRREMEKRIPLGIKYASSVPEVVGRARELAGIVALAAQHGMYKATCLRRSLLTWLFLRREGIRSQICIGVRLVDRQLVAHAWVEYDGTIISDSPEIRTVFRRLEHTRPPINKGL